MLEHSLFDDSNPYVKNQSFSSNSLSLSHTLSLSVVSLLITIQKPLDCSYDLCVCNFFGFGIQVI